MGFEIDKLVRNNIRRLVPYSSARGEFGGGARIFLDANENSFGSPLAADHSRYPDPLQTAVKEKIAALNGVRPAQIFVGNGSDEAIDLLFRIFCRPQVDNVLICPPTYGMYEVAAAINDVAVKRANLTDGFDLDVEAILGAVDENTKLIFFCSPNNPTGNLMDRESVLEIISSVDAVVVVDEAYIHFSDAASLTAEINNFPNLVVLQTFSKAWGLAGLRVGKAFANEQIIRLFNSIKPPYNVSQASQDLISAALENEELVADTTARIVRERDSLADDLGNFSFIANVYPSDANFLLVKVENVSRIYSCLLDSGIVVRNRSNVILCEGCLRITAGTPEENRALLDALEKYEKSPIH